MSWGRKSKWRCRHDNVRCVHGDEINMRSGRIAVRRACVDCGASLSGHLPKVCTITGHRHFSTSDS